MEEIKNQNDQIETTDEQVDKSEPERQVKMLTEDEVNEIVRKRINKVKEKYADYDQLKAQLDELLQEKKAREEAELSEIERLKKHLSEKDDIVSSLQKELEKLNEMNRKRTIEMAFREKAREAGIAYIDDALRLADLSGVEIDGDEVRGVDEIVKKLTEEKPFLLAQNKPQQRAIGGPSNFEQDKNEIKSKEELLKAAAEKAMKSGRIEDRVKYALLKKELGI